jgi:hypothetical protein
MANSYDAIFRSIKTSTIWVNAPYVKVVWINMLLSTDKNGIVEGSIPGLAKDAVVTVEQCREAIAIFLAPDPDSRTKDFEGRRIEEVDGGWRILNHRKYKEKREKAAQAHAAAQARYRVKSDASRYHGDTSYDDPDLQISRSPDPKEEKNLSSRDEKEEPSFALATHTLEPIQSKSKKTKPPADFQPNQTTLARATDLGEDWTRHWQDCSDWAASNGKLKADWQATLRNWMSGSKGKYPTRKAMVPKLQEPAQPPRSPEITDADRQRQLAAREQAAINDRLARGIAPPERTMFTDTERKRILSGAK